MNRRFRSRERGVALPMAMMMLMLLTTLMLAFSVLAQTEPVIAANHLRVTQARALADSGFERALWALSCGFQNATTAGSCTNASAIAFPLPGTVPQPYDGTQLVSLSGGATTLGGFVVTVVADPAGDPDVRQITSVGWTPNNTVTDIRPKAHRKIQASVSVIPSLAINAPCALCVKGALNVGGHSAINGTNTNTNCGGNNKYGTFTQDATSSGGSSVITGGAGGIAQNQPASAFNDFTLRDKAMNALKELAKKNGTYYGPGYPNGGTTPSSGTYSCSSVSFNSANRVNNGIIFVDTCDGTNVTTSSASSNLAQVTINGNPFTGLAGSLTGVQDSTSPSDAFNGWLIVNGSLNISGNMQINGMVYAANDLTYNGTGTGAINGLVISQNTLDTSATSIDSTTLGNSAITFDCDKARQPNVVPTTFSLVNGTYRELTGQ